MFTLFNYLLTILSSTNDLMGYVAIAGFVMLILSYIGDPKIFKDKKLLFKVGLIIVVVFVASMILQFGLNYLLTSYIVKYF